MEIKLPIPKGEISSRDFRMMKIFVGEIPTPVSDFGSRDFGMMKIFLIPFFQSLHMGLWFYYNLI